MPALGSYSYLGGPLVILAALGFLCLVLKYTYRGRPSSLVAKKPVRGSATEYGLLVPVASPPTFVEGEVVRRRLEAGGVRATLVSTNDGPRVMVFPKDEQRARDAIAS